MLRTIVFIDGQNLYRSAMEKWHKKGKDEVYTWPSYDVQKIALALVSRKGNRSLNQIRFYSGVPRSDQDAFWHSFWTNKIRHLLNQGIYVYKGRLNSSGQEKGVDVSIATDLVWCTYENKYDLAIIVSQDADFGPAVQLSKEIAKQHGNHILFESAYIPRPGKSKRGIPGTEWFCIDKKLYDSCHDPADYRPSPIT